MSPQPKHLTYTDVPKTVDMTLAAFEHDPLQRYIFETPDGHNARAIRASQQIDWSAIYTELVHQDAIWTIDDVASVVGYFDPYREKDAVDKFLEWIFHYGGLYKKAILSREQAKREKEVGDKFRQAVADVLGERRETMVHIGIVCTAPEKQGHGYASTLVRLVTAKVRILQRSTWLISSNALNEGFYNSLGFETVKEIVLGDDNPTWDEPLVVIGLMVREYEGSIKA